MAQPRPLQTGLVRIFDWNPDFFSKLTEFFQFLTEFFQFLSEFFWFLSEWFFLRLRITIAQVKEFCVLNQDLVFTVKRKICWPALAFVTIVYPERLWRGHYSDTEHSLAANAAASSSKHTHFIILLRPIFLLSSRTLMDFQQIPARIRFLESKSWLLCHMIDTYSFALVMFPHSDRYFPPTILIFSCAMDHSRSILAQILLNWWFLWLPAGLGILYDSASTKIFSAGTPCFIAVFHYLGFWIVQNPIQLPQAQSLHLTIFHSFGKNTRRFRFLKWKRQWPISKEEQSMFFE